MTTEPDDDLVPVSVRLGDVVPPEDPEDWTRPLTWAAAIGMLAGPLVVLGWFAFAPPTGAEAVPATYLAATALAGGAALTGGTQQGRARAWTATLGAGLFGALVVVVIGAVTAGERVVGSAPPTIDHAVMAALSGLAGSAAAAIAAASVAASRSRASRVAVPMLVGAVGAVAVTGLLS